MTPEELDQIEARAKAARKDVPTLVAALRRVLAMADDWEDAADRLEDAGLFASLRGAAEAIRVAVEWQADE